jgi:uncharacterized membrane protein YbhN (UPF0104 family)
MRIALPKLSSNGLRALQFLCTGMLALLLWEAADGPEIVHILASAQPLWLLAAVGALVLQTVLSAIRWKVTAAQLDQQLPLARAVKEYFLSQAINQALPGAVMGDAARAVRACGTAGLAISGQAVIFERLAGQITMFLTMATAFVVTFFADGGLTWPPTFVAPLAIMVVAGSMVLGLLIGGSYWLAALGPRISYWLKPLQRALFARDVMPAQIVLGIAITMCNLAAFAICALAVGVVMPLAAVLAIVPVVLFSMLIPFTVSGWGIREGSAAVLLPLADVEPSAAVASSVMFGIAILIAVLPGLFVAGGK